jgi:putative transposase
MVEKDHPRLSIVRQCRLLGLPRSTFYNVPRGEGDLNLLLMRLIDAQFLETPFYGSRQMCRHLRHEGFAVGRRRVKRLMRKMGLTAVYQKPRTTVPHPEHRVYPYLLRDLRVERPDQVWCADITYVPMRRGYLYLVAIMDWYSRTVLSWRLSNTMDADFCVAALEDAMNRYGTPEIFNTDQGSQFTSQEFTRMLKSAGVRISMDGKGRWMDNVFIERLWRSVKWECVYLREFETGSQVRKALGDWFAFYNERRPHSAFDGQRPLDVYRGHTPGRGGHAPLSPATRKAA